MHVYPMNKLFNGYNLTFSSSVQLDGVSIVQPLTKQGSGTTAQYGSDMIDVANFQTPGGMVNYAVL